jgi:hypothetical protein
MFNPKYNFTYTTPIPPTYACADMAPSWNNLRLTSVSVFFHPMLYPSDLSLMVPRHRSREAPLGHPIPKGVYLSMVDVHKQLFTYTSITMASFRKALYHPSNQGFCLVEDDRDLIEMLVAEGVLNNYKATKTTIIDFTALIQAMKLLQCSTAMVKQVCICMHMHMHMDLHIQVYTHTQTHKHTQVAELQFSCQEEYITPYTTPKPVEDEVVEQMEEEVEQMEEEVEQLGEEEEEEWPTRIPTGNVYKPKLVNAKRFGLKKEDR